MPYCLPTSLDLAPVFSGHALSCGWSRHLVVGTLSFVLSLCWFLLIWTKRGVRKIGEKDCALQSQLGVCNQFTCFKIQLHMLQLGFHFISNVWSFAMQLVAIAISSRKSRCNGRKPSAPSVPWNGCNLMQQPSSIGHDVKLWIAADSIDYKCPFVF